MMSLGDVAAKLGLPVFPCNGKKEPVIAKGFHAASLEPNAIRRMFDRQGATMIGIPTGEASGLVVIDVDIKHGKRGMDWLNANSHRLPSTRTHKTESGGLHLVFRQPEDFDLRGSVDKIHNGIDVRANGNYVIFPPSPGYQVADDAAPAEMPNWLISVALNAGKEDRPAPEPRNGPREVHEKYIQAALDGEISTVLRAGEGSRNDTLNRAAFNVGTLVGAGVVARSTAEDELRRAARGAGLNGHEIEATIRSGLDAGTAKPRELPERERVTRHSDTPSVTPVTPRKPAQLLWFDDIQPCLDAKDFVEGLLIEGTAAVVYGESNAGKTFWTTDLALHVAAGMPWNGREVDQGGVIYCVLEGGIGFANRVAAWRGTNGLCSIPFAARQSSLNLLHPDVDVEDLIALIHEAAATIHMPVKLIVVDTLARAFAGGNENASEDMGALVLNIDRIRRETGACVLFVHHSGKDQARGARGHSSLRAAVDTEIEVVGQEDVAEKSATVVKQRDLPKGDTFGFKLDVVVLGKNRRGKDATSCVVVPLEGVEAPRKVRAVSKNEKLGMRALDLALDKAGAHLPPNSEYPPDTWATGFETWRQEFYQLHGEDPDKARVNFNRAKIALLADKFITQRGNYVWKARGPKR